MCTPATSGIRPAQGACRRAGAVVTLRVLAHRPARRDLPCACACACSPFVCKIVRDTHDTGSAEAMERCRREIAILRQLRHPNIIALQASFDTPDRVRVRARPGASTPGCRTLDQAVPLD